MERGIVARSRSALIPERFVGSVGFAKGDGWDMPWPSTMFCASAIPWDLVEFAFTLAGKWDIVVPFDRSGALASQVGDTRDRAHTERVCGDLRQPLYSTELVVVGPGGALTLHAWRHECGGGDERLALLRAIHTTPCRVYAAPRAWLQAQSERARMVQ